MSSAAIRMSGLSAGYNGQPVINDMNLEVQSGVMCGLFGANGAGKTTTLMVAAGEVAPLSGTIELAGIPHPGSLYQAAKTRGLALLTDDRGIFPQLTARDNLRLGKGSIEDALAFFPELEPHLDRRAGLLSGGQQQMLALGRLLASSPSIVLADELSLGLAPKVVARLVQALRSAADQGAAVLLVEQHVPVALAAVDYAYVLSRGSVALAEEAAVLREHPERITEFYLSAG